MKFSFRRPFDAHKHLRDAAILKYVARHALWAWGGIVMPNLDPPVDTLAITRAYRARIDEATEGAFMPCMVAYLTKNLDVGELRESYVGRDPIDRIWHAVKSYPKDPKHGTTGSQFGLDSIFERRDVLEFCQETGMPLLLHAELPKWSDKQIGVFNQEKAYVEFVLDDLLRDFPNLRVVVEHVSDKRTINLINQYNERYVREKKAIRLFATITPHHPWLNSDALFEGGLRPLIYCKPVYKDEESRLAVLKAMTSGKPWYFLGTDSAPHPIGKKFCECGAAGVFNEVAALPTYVEMFEREKSLEHLEAFASILGPEFYGFEPSSEKVVLVKETNEVPLGDSAFDGGFIHNFRCGEKLPWKIAA